MVQPNMDLDEPLTKEWIVSNSNGQIADNKSYATMSQFSKTGFTTNKQLKTLNNEYTAGMAPPPVQEHQKRFTMPAQYEELQ